jgi:hypothetical protein
MRRKAGFRFEVEVRGAALDGIGEQGVDQPHHGLGVGIAPAGKAGGVGLAGFDLVEDPVDGQFVPIEQVDGAGDLRVAGEAQFDGGTAGSRLRSWSWATMSPVLLERPPDAAARRRS